MFILLKPTPNKNKAKTLTENPMLTCHVTYDHHTSLIKETKSTTPRCSLSAYTDTYIHGYPKIMLATVLFSCYVEHEDPSPALLISPAHLKKHCFFSLLAKIPNQLIDALQKAK